MFVAVSGFLFGQLFSGRFELAATLAGVFGLIAAVPGPGKTNLVPTRAWVVLACSVLALVGVGLDAHDYYSREHSSGNYYAWFLIGPFCVAVALLGAHAMKSLLVRSVGPVEASPDRSVESDR